MAKGKTTVKDLLSRIENIGKKQDKFEETKEEKTEKKFAQVPLADGETVLEYDGELAAGTAVFVVGEDGEQMAAPEGTHELGGDMAGTSIIVNADGIIDEVVTEQVEEEAKEEAPEEEAMSTEEISKVIEAKVVELLKPLTDKFEAMSNENSELKEAFEKFKEEPKAAEEKKKFNRQEDMTPKQRMIMSRTNKKRK